ncbi:MAG: DUF2779 domain-containing protein [Balneolaceae bacterium]
MKNGSDQLLTDHLFHQAISCPLKLYFIQLPENRVKRDGNFRQKNKLVLRDAIAQRFSNVFYTQNDVREAEFETAEWLKNDEVVICGAVIRHGNFLTRIPILKKSGNELTIIQVHGKLKKGNSVVFDKHGRSRSITGYLIKAAYRYQIVENAFPDYQLFTEFVMPKSRYKSSVENLFQNTLGKKNISKEFLEELDNLFAFTDGTKSVLEVIRCLPETHTHHSFSGLSVSEALAKIEELQVQPIEKQIPQIHDGCKYCEFRQSTENNENGCWQTFFSDESLNNPDKHTFELIGHSMRSESEENFFQEKIDQPFNLHTVEQIVQYPSNVITMQQRRALQLLRAKNKEVPLIWGKPELKTVAEVAYPHHFIDFEAATSAVPMAKDQKVYDQVLFQFSCHTELENGEIIHSEWVDEDPAGYPHPNFVKAICAIPHIEKGTLIQFSPFEKQSLYKLMREIEATPTVEAALKAQFKKVLTGENDQPAERFFDLSKVIRDGYYNRYMDEGLTLKETLKNILQVERSLNLGSLDPIVLHDIAVQLSSLKPNGVVKNPYKLLMDDHLKIGDGMAAMNAYISLKTGVVSAEDRQLIPKFLKRYCALDSYALYVIMRHIKMIINKNPQMDEILIFPEMITD